MKRVVMTGATGFLGSHLISLLKQNGFEVYVVGKPIDLLHHHDFVSLLEPLQGEILIHLAWETTPGLFWESPLNIDWLTSSLKLFKAFQQVGGKWIIGAGSSAEFPHMKSPCPESNSESPPTLYGRAKHSLFTTTQKWAELIGMSFTWCRIFYPFGEGDSSKRFLSLCVQALLQEKIFECRTHYFVRDFIHIEDIANAFLQILLHRIEGEINIGTGVGTSLAEAAYSLAKKLNKQHLIRLLPINKSNTQPEYLVSSCQRLQKEAQWAPTICLDEGFERLIQWWKNENNNRHK